MKGLFVTDWELLKKQKRIMILMVLLMVFFIFLDMPEFAVGYFVMLGALFAIRITMLEMDKPQRFTFTLPFTKIQYVTEKYLLACICAVGCGLLSLVFAAMQRASLQLLPIFFLSLLGALLEADLFIPLLLQFGNKAMIYLSIGFAVLVGGIAALGDSLIGIMSAIQSSVWMLVLIGIILTSVSVWLSILIIQKKRF